MLEVHNLHMRFGPVTALAGVSFAAPDGQITGLLGENGAGKTTTLNILTGLFQPDRGDIRVDGEPADATAHRRRSVGALLDQKGLYPRLTARENVALVTDIVPRPFAAEDVLGLVGLGDRLDHFPAQLSGGEQQRVAIARAVAKNPALLLCDEPTGALDITTGIVVLEAIARVNDELGTSTVVITHNAAIAAMADRVVRLADGKVVGVERHAHKIKASDLTW